jgi:hypothetical protein
METKYELIRKAAVTLGLSIVVAAAIIGWSLPESPEGQKFQGFVVDNKIVRLNTRDGNMVACDFSRCVRILGNGKDLQPNSAPGLIRGSDAAPPVGKPSISAPGQSPPSER